MTDQRLLNIIASIPDSGCQNSHINEAIAYVDAPEALPEATRNLPFNERIDVLSDAERTAYDAVRAERWAEVRSILPVEFRVAGNAVNDYNHSGGIDSRELVSALIGAASKLNHASRSLGNAGVLMAALPAEEVREAGAQLCPRVRNADGIAGRCTP